jgi:quercetin dioxygenase-like cupin family protein
MRLLAPLLLTSAVLLAQDPLTLDPAHYTVALENQHVRALVVRYGPGEGSPMHDHPHGVGVALTNTKGRFQMPDGSVRESSGTSAGAVFWRGATRHANKNMLDTPAEMIEVDLKLVPARAPGQVSTSDPPDPTETVEIENEFVRVLRSRLSPGGKTARLSRPDRVLIALRDQRLRVKPAEGESSARRFRRGDVVWQEAGTVTVENVGTEAAETVIIELKPAK